MQLLCRILLFFTVIISFTNGLERPSYLEPCSATDANINDCIVKNGNKAIQSLVKGDKSLQIPSLNPLKIDEAVLEPGSNLKLTLKKFSLSGLENVEIAKSTSEIANKHFGLTLKTPKIEIVGDYEVEGKILILPITGKGPVNITMENLVFDYSLDYDVEKVDGVEYMKIKEQKLTYEPSHVYFGFENLFDGNEKLAEEMKTFLNENWKDINKEFSGSVSKTVLILVEKVLNRILSQIPYSELFLP